MKALTLYQPYASAIAWSGKLIENREWPPPRSLLGQRIAIHAGAKKRDEQWGLPADIDARDLAEPLPRSAVVCTAVVFGALDLTNPKRPQMSMCLRSTTNQIEFRVRMIETMPKDRWWVGPVGWLLGEVRSLAEPVPCKGAMGLWTLSPEVEEEVLRRTEYRATREADCWLVRTPRDERRISMEFGDEADAIELARQLVQRDLWADRYLARPDEPLLARGER